MPEFETECNYEDAAWWEIEPRDTWNNFVQLQFLTLKWHPINAKLFSSEFTLEAVETFSSLKHLHTFTYNGQLETFNALELSFS